MEKGLDKIDRRLTLIENMFMMGAIQLTKDVKQEIKNMEERGEVENKK